MTFQLFSVQGLILYLSFFAAGIIDSVCGGGGLLTIPTFMMIGFPGHLITGTNQCSIVAGSLASAAGYAKAGKVHWPTALMTMPAAVAGAYLGARLNMLMPEEYLERVMLVMLPVAAVTLLLKRNFGQENLTNSLSKPRQILSSLFIGLLVGGYQGFYGAASGTFMLLGFSLLLKLDLVTAGGNTRLVGVVSCLVASATYGLSGAIVFPVVLGATCFNIAGSILGTRLALTRGAKFIRPMFLMILALLFLRLAAGFLMK